MRSALLILTLVVVGLLVFAWRGGGSRTLVPAPGQGGSSPSRAESARETLGAPAARDRTEYAGESADNLAPKLRVLVTLGDGSPAAAATVRFLGVRFAGATADGTRAGRAAPEDDDARVDAEAELQATGQVAVTDPRGVVEVAAQPGTVLCARLGEAYAEARVADDERELRLVLRRDVFLRVQVVDADGRPRQGFEVEAKVEADSRREGKRGDSESLPFTLPLTDAAGMTVLPHAQQSLAMPGPDVVAWSMRLRYTVGSKLERAVTADELLDGKPIRISVPVGGAIVVEVVDPDGERIWGYVDLEETGTGASLDADGNDGGLWFRQLPLGRHWTVRVSLFGEEVQKSLAGPTAIDQVVRTRIQLPLREFTVKGRLVRADGVPVPRANLTLTTASLQSLHTGGTETRDGSLGDRIGEFGFFGALPAGVDALEGATLHAERESYFASCTIALPSTLRPGDNDLGDVVVPVPADQMLLATVSVHRAGKDVTAGAKAFLYEEQDGDVLSRISLTHHRGDVIAFHGPRTNLPLELKCSHPGCVSRWVPIRLGEHKIVDLEPAARLTLHLRWPTVPQSLCRAQLILGDGQEDVSHLRTEDGFEWRDLAPGRYALRILVDGRVVHEVPVLELVASDNTWPTDGTSFDLRATARAFHVDIRDADGAPVEWPNVFAVPADGSAPPAELSATDVRQTLRSWFVPRDVPVDLVITSEGFVPVRLPQPAADVQVRLARCAVLRVVPAAGNGSAPWFASPPTPCAIRGCSGSTATRTTKRPSTRRTSRTNCSTRRAPWLT